MKLVSGNLSSEDDVNRTVVRCFVGIFFKLLLLLLSVTLAMRKTLFINNIEDGEEVAGCSGLHPYNERNIKFRLFVACLLYTSRCV